MRNSKTILFCILLIYMYVGYSQKYSITKADSALAKAEVPEKVSTEKNSNIICRVQKVNATDSFDTGFIVDNALNTIMYPGVIILRDDLLSGNYRTYNAPRKPIVLSTDLPIENGNPYIQVDDPNALHQLRAAKNMLIDNQELGNAMTQASYILEQYYSDEQLEMAFGGYFSRKGIRISGKLGLEKSTTKNTIVAQYLQKLYTINMDQPVGPQDFFADGIRTYRDLIERNNVPLYVSAVTYGRTAYFFYESEDTSEKIKSKLEIVFKEAGTKAGANAKIALESLLEKGTLKVLVIGGSTNAAAKIIDGFEGFEEAIKFENDKPLEHYAAPISYTLKFLNNDIAFVNLTTTYVKRTCNSLKDLYRLKVNRIVCTKVSAEEPGSENEIKGYIHLSASADNAKSLIGTSGIISPSNVSTTDVNLAKKTSRINPAYKLIRKNRVEGKGIFLLNAAESAINLKESIMDRPEDGFFINEYATFNLNDPNGNLYKNIAFNIDIQLMEVDDTSKNDKLKKKVIYPLQDIPINEPFAVTVQASGDIFKVYFVLEEIIN